MNTEKIVLSRKVGVALVLTGAVLWGISGTVAQYLFQQQGFSPEWLVVIRLLLSGIILLGIAYRKEKQNIWGIWKNNQERLNLILFGILGMLAVQYTYFAAIKHGNAATATILQYLAPVLITCYVAIRLKRFPTLKELLAVILALLGTFLLVTHGSIRSLSISGWALFWGIASAVALAFYTLHPHKLLAKWGAAIVVGWAMLIGGIGFSLVHPPWRLEGQWSISSSLAVIFIVLFGTLIAFYCYLESLKYLSASETSLLACVEPVSAAVLSVIWLHVSFGFTDWVGTLCILVTIAILSLGGNKETVKTN
ncbi:DMT family transporter [Brevibacillus laterosporus]|uniref:DMT family transporter n=1 Tax=Brevibacillus laterosporus TaxID=1465 RepID=UPI0014441206|nr:EamA family transporter [Brevibacillus laterosporus]NKQ18655.1 EamA family transporter [Brevibacillus laterosporus]WNX33422.1 EamA family transporter [Brevibacillus laterosporus]